MEDYSVNIERHGGWEPPANGITVAQAAPGVTTRKQSDLDALPSTKKIVFDLSGSKTEAVLLRIRSDGSENDANVLEMYLGMKGDHYQNVGQLTCDQGQQSLDGTYFADTITPASELALFDGEEQNTTNAIGLYYMRTFGFDTLVIIASTLASTTVYVDKKDVGKA